MKTILLITVLVTTLSSGTLPNRKFTPGDINPFVMLNWVCNHYIDSFPPSISDVKKAYANYGISISDVNYKLDYLIPISLGGENSVKNMWPQTTRQWLAKNKIENDMLFDVCNGKVSLSEVQILLAKDWTSWKKVDTLISSTFTKDSIKTYIFKQVPTKPVKK